MAALSRLSLSPLTAMLIAAPVLAAVPTVAPDQLAQLRSQEGARAQQSVSHLMGLRSQLGLDSDADLKPAKIHTDELGQTHTHIQQLYRGVKVWGGEAIAHMDKNGAFQPATSSLKAGISLNAVPSMKSDEALAIAHADLAPKGAYTTKPTAELVVFPVMAQVHTGPGTDATSYEYQPVRYALAYHIHTDLQNGTGETKQTDYMIDAHTGAVLSKWSSLETSAAVGTGNSQYSGTVHINTNSISGGYELRDMTRGTGGTFGNNVVTNLNHATTGNGTIYTDADNTWGDGANYVEGSSTTAANGETAAVDAAFGIQATWDMYKNVLGRNGIDGAGKASYLRVHYSNSYDNAFWDDTCFCMTFGDGRSFTTLTCVDVAGHEMSHGVIANSVPGGLNYSGESGGLNESNSDIFGTMVEFYDLGGGEASGATTVPTTGGNWTIGEQLAATPLRYMYKPSLDGTSPDYYSSTIGNLDVHYSSGIGNRAFYFLSQGSSSSSTSNYYSTYLPSGMTGVGNDHATRIHYRAMTTYYTSTETYAQARTAHMNAAADLYGTGSAEYAAVQNAFHGINVGAAAPGSSALAASITTPSGNVTVATGSSVSFAGSASGGSSPYTYSWTFGDGGTSTSASTSHTYTNTGTTNVTYTATFKVTDSLGATSSATRSITVTPTGSTGGTELMVNGGYESGTSPWTGTTGDIGAFTGESAHSGTRYCWLDGYGTAHTEYIAQAITVPSGGATLSFYLHIDTAETTTTTAYDTLKVQVLNSAGTVLGTLATFSNLNAASGYTQHSYSLGAYAGQTVTIKFLGVEDSSLQTSFVIDDVSAK